MTWAPLVFTWAAIIICLYYFRLLVPTTLLAAVYACLAWPSGPRSPDSSDVGSSGVARKGAGAGPIPPSQKTRKPLKPSRPPLKRPYTNPLTPPDAARMPTTMATPYPPAAALCRIENRLAAATLPMVACHAAASDPAAMPPLVKPHMGITTERITGDNARQTREAAVA